jgi:sulfopyruvate decarboxylase subunit beta
MKRYDCLKVLTAEVKDALVVSSAGAMTLEWNSLHPSDGNFRVRTLGLCSSIALGMALGLPHRKVVALDGDGSLLMNLCALPTIARMRPPNLVHIVFDNEVYEASGSKQTATGTGTDLVGIARAAGIKNSQWANTVDEFAEIAAAGLRGSELCFIGAKVSTERTPVPPFPIDEVENKYRFMRHIEKSEGIEIFKTNLPASYV